MTAGVSLRAPPLDPKVVINLQREVLQVVTLHGLETLDPFNYST